MTSKKKTILAIAIFVLLLGAVILTQRDPYEKKTDSEIPKVPELDKATVDKVEIVNTTEALTFNKKNNKWFVTSNNGKEYKTEETFEVMVLDKLKKIKIERIVSEKKSKHSNFKVDEKGTRVRVYANGKKLLSLIVGKNTPDYRGTFFRFPDSNTVYASSGIIGGSLKRSLRDWRYKKLMDISRVDVEKITFHVEKKKSFSLLLTPAPVKPDAKEGEAGEDAKWKLEGNDKVEIDQSKVTSLLNLVTSMVWSEAIDEPKDLKEYGLNSPKYWIELTTKDKKKIKLNLGKTIEDKHMAFVNIEGKKGVFKVHKYQYDRLLNKLEHYKKAKKSK